MEFDDRPKDFQLNFWKSYGLPEPTLVVDSGNKSLHTYWALTEPIHPETWSTLQKGLVVWVGSDPACVNPSRCMRAPGFIHQKTGKRSQIVSCSGKQHKPDTFKTSFPRIFKSFREPNQKALANGRCNSMPHLWTGRCGLPYSRKWKPHPMPSRPTISSS